MNIQLNGNSYTTDANTLADVIAEQNLVNKRFAVEVNGELVLKSELANIDVTDNMTVEIVVAVGGG